MRRPLAVGCLVLIVALLSLPFLEPLNPIEAQSGPEDAVDGFADTKPPDTPDLIFLLDQSGSMDDWVADGRKLDLAIDAIDNAYQDIQKSGTPAEVIAYSGECNGWPPSQLQDMPQVRRVDWRNAETAKDTLTADGGTPTDVALLGALYRLGVVDAFGNPTGRETGTIILVSDGASNGCESPCDVARDYGAGLVKVHSVGFDIAEDENAVQELACIARETGGVAITVDDYKELQKEIRKLAQLEAPVELEVRAADAVINVKATITNNVALDNAYLKIVGPSSLLMDASAPLVDSTQFKATACDDLTKKLCVETSLGDLSANATTVVPYKWSSKPCDALNELVEFYVGGDRADVALSEPESLTEIISGAISARDRASLFTVEDLLLEGMTPRRIEDVCPDPTLRTRYDSGATGRADDDTQQNQSSDTLKYGSASLAGALAAMAASRIKAARRESEDRAQYREPRSSNEDSSADHADGYEEFLEELVDEIADGYISSEDFEKVLDDYVARNPGRFGKTASEINRWVNRLRKLARAGCHQ